MEEQKASKIEKHFNDRPNPFIKLPSHKAHKERGFSCQKYLIVSQLQFSADIFLPLVKPRTISKVSVI